MLNPLPPDEIGMRLAQTVPILKRLTVGISHELWLLRPEPGEWSITEIICHLRDVDREVHLPRFNSLIAEKEPFMAGVVSDEWTIERNYQTQDGPLALVELETTRSELLQLLPPAESPIWERRGRHTFFGPTSFLELACLVLEHDLLHIEQVKEIISAGQMS